jgi:hypothetical protein
LPLSEAKKVSTLWREAQVVSSNATPEELRAEIAKRIAMLRDRGYVDLDALPQPANKEGAIADAEGDEDDSICKFAGPLRCLVTDFLKPEDAPPPPIIRSITSSPTVSVKHLEPRRTATSC